MQDYVVWALPTLSRCLLVAGVATKPSPYRWMIWPLVVAVSCYYCIWTTPSHHTYATISRMILTIFIASDFILLTDVQRELRLVGQRDPISNQGLWARLKWSLHLLCSDRGVGWAHEPKSVLPPHPKSTRAQFLASRLRWLLAWGLIYDVATIFIRSDPRLAKGAPPIAQLPWLRRCCMFLFSMPGGIASMSMVHIVAALLSVGGGSSEPEMRPHLMGRWSDAYTIRRLWG